ncbi:MBOAT family O-acyltransferase [Spirulina sp. CCNP1310]|uniref:MBOAT family O-acyltransferase n=1 Tax=Spirulina sp. CCNP1310 TaxID=3110249 RepID=UPI002B203133|nr:MBOAT family O-acyltransferase [Spirulina sp. CCNP1310]MEA5421343.1 MBOAT family O-acyltransferase [Spirulina sp. CCNP1310]
MNFASIEFFQFLFIVYGLYLILPHRWQNWLLLGASYYFYGSWDWRFLSLILLSTTVDFWVSKFIHATEDQRRKKQLLSISLIVNLGLLGFFKYFGFFTESFATFAASLGLQTDWRMLNIILPVGISFYTFQTLSYTIDVYRGKLQPAPRFWDFALFLSFFPQLVAGPIERASHFLPQVISKRTITFDQITRGCFLILFGLFKKVAIADGVAGSVNAIYNSTGVVGTLDIILATYLFAIQIYCDFSGYSDIARGVCKLMGFDLMVNFETPYFAVNPSDFWRRWHISLSTWLRDYLYIPLGGNRHGTRQTYRNLMLTMTLGGLWHGAAWNFIYWGIYQGGILCLHRLIAGAKPTIRPVVTLQDRLRRSLIIIIFFQIVCYGWLLFRASSWQQIYHFTDLLFFHPLWMSPIIPDPPLSALIGMILLVIVDLAHYVSGKATFYRRWSVPIKSALYAGLLIVILMGLSNTGATFIYFQF